MNIKYKYGKKYLFVVAGFAMAILLSSCAATNRDTHNDVEKTQGKNEETSAQPPSSPPDMGEEDHIRFAFEEYYPSDEAAHLTRVFYQMYLEASDYIIDQVLAVKFQITEAKLIPFQSCIDYDQVAMLHSLQLSDGNHHSLIISVVDPNSAYLEGTAELDGITVFRRIYVRQTMTEEEFLKTNWDESDVEIISCALDNAKMEGVAEVDASTYYKTMLLSLYYNNYGFSGIRCAEVIRVPDQTIPNQERDKLSFAISVIDQDENTILVYQSAIELKASYILVQRNEKTIRSIIAWKGVERLISSDENIVY